MNRELSYDQCYRMLQLQPGASLAEIKHRYRELARRSHPDAVPAAQREYATHQFQQINYAKEVLEDYWEQYQCAPPTALQQRVQEAKRYQAAEPQPRTEPAWYVRTEQRRQSLHWPREERKQNSWEEQRRKPVQAVSSLTMLDRMFFVTATEAVILLLLWLDYHVLTTLHGYLTAFHTQTAAAVFVKVYLSVTFLVLLVCGYISGICLTLLALAFLIFRQEKVLAMLSARRKRTGDPFPHLFSPSAPRRR